MVSLEAEISGQHDTDSKEMDSFALTFFSRFLGSQDAFCGLQVFRGLPLFFWSFVTFLEISDTVFCSNEASFPSTSVSV